MKTRTKKRLTALIVTLTIAAGGVFALKTFRNTGRAAVAEGKLEEGRTLYEQGRFADAIAPLNIYVESGGRDPEAMLMFADARRKTPQENNRHLLQAVTIATEVANTEDPPGEAHAMLMELYPQLGRVPELVELTADIQERDPSNIRAGLLRAEGLRMLGRESESREVIDELAARFPSDADVQILRLDILADEAEPTVLLNEALTLASQESVDTKILLVASQTLLRLTNDQAAMTRLFTSLREAEQTDATWEGFEGIETATALRENIELRAANLLQEVLAELQNEPPEIVEIAIGLCEIASSVDDLLAAEAEAFINRALESEDAPELRSLAIQRRWKQGEIQAALTALVRSVSPPSEASTDDLGLLLVTLNEPDAPVEGETDALRDAVSRELLNRTTDAAAISWIAIAEGVSAFHAGDAIAARESLEVESREAMASSAGLRGDVASFLAARSLIRAGEPQAGLERLQDLAPQPAWRRARYAVATVSIENGDLRTAIAVLRQDPSLSRWPNGAALVTIAAVMQAELPNSTSAHQGLALQASENFFAFQPDTARSVALRGRALLAAGQVDGALEMADELLALEIGSASAEVADFADRLADVDSELSASLSQRSLEAATSRLGLIIDRFQNLIDSGQIDEAEQELDRVDAASAASDTSPALTDRISMAVARAIVARERGDSGAIQALADLSRKYPTSPVPQIALLDSPGAWNDLDLIEETIGRLEAISGGDGTRAKLHQARLDMQRDNSEAAASAALIQIEEVLRRTPRSRQALVLAADANTRLGDDTAAADALDRARAVDPTHAPIYPSLIAALVASGQAAEALDRAEDFARLDLRDPSLRSVRARVLESVGLRELALADRRAIQEQSGGTASQSTALALSLAQFGDTEGAASVIETIDANELTDQDLPAYAEALVRIGEKTRGIESLGTDDPSEIGALLLTAGNAASALPYLLDAARATSGDERAWQTATLAALVTDDMVRADQIADQASRAVPSSDLLRAISSLLGDPNAPTWTPIATSAGLIAATSEADGAEQLSTLVTRLLASASNEIRQGQTDGRAAQQGIADLQRFTTRSPEWYPAWLLLVEMHASSNNLTDATSAARSAVQALPGQVKPIADATTLLLRAGEFRQAASLAQEWLELTPQNPRRAEISLASAYSGIGRSAEARALFAQHEDFLFSSPLQWSGPIEQAIVSVAATDGFDTADELIRKYNDQPAEQRPAWGSIVVRMASIVPNQRVEIARSWLELAEESLTSAPRGRFLLVSGWNALAGRTGEASDYERSIASAGTGELDAATYAAKAASLSSLGRLAEAVEAYEQSYAQGGRDPYMLNNLAYHLVLTNGDASRARSIAREAIAQADEARISRNDRKEMLDTLGLALILTGEADEAVTTFREAISLDSSNAPHLRLGLAEAHLLAGNREEARSVLDRVSADSLSGQLLTRYQAIEADL